MGVWEYGSMGVWEYGSAKDYRTYNFFLNSKFSFVLYHTSIVCV
jgi:hypothetical protein